MRSRSRIGSAAALAFLLRIAALAAFVLAAVAFGDGATGTCASDAFIGVLLVCAAEVTDG